MSSDAIQELFEIIELLETTVSKQNKVITELLNENVEQENFINELLQEQLT